MYEQDQATAKLAIDFKKAKEMLYGTAATADGDNSDARNYLCTGVGVEYHCSHARAAWLRSHRCVTLRGHQLLHRAFPATQHQFPPMLPRLPLIAIIYMTKLD
jgi:hypothetical protein